MTNEYPVLSPLVLTLAVAGKRRIDPAHRGVMEDGLASVFALAEAGLKKHAAGHGARLTLITGLADGADQIAGSLFLSQRGRHPRVPRMLGAVLPCRRDDFARCSPVEDRAAFDRSAASCSFVVEMDGVMRPLPPDDLTSEFARKVRDSRGEVFAAQGKMLIEKCDILIAVDHPKDAGEVGGTRHTLTRALEEPRPVVLLRLGEPGLYLPRAGASLDRSDGMTGSKARRAVAAVVDAVLERKRPAAIAERL